MPNIRKWPAILRASGLTVYEEPGWLTRNDHGEMPDEVRAIFWHHDATPAGRTNTLGWLIGNFSNNGDTAGSSQLWTDYDGGWHFCNVGVAWHAGKVRGPLDSFNSVGVETDHTTGEFYTEQHLNSLHLGFAVLAKAHGRGADFITMHKIEAAPFGRKQDPWLSARSNNTANYQSELNEQRAIIQGLIDGAAPPPPSPPTKTAEQIEEEELMSAKDDILSAIEILPKRVWTTGITSNDAGGHSNEMLAAIQAAAQAAQAAAQAATTAAQAILGGKARPNETSLQLVRAVDSDSGAIFAYGPGVFFYIGDPELITVGQDAGLLSPEVKETNRRGLDVIQRVMLHSNLDTQASATATSGPAAPPAPDTGRTVTVNAGDTLSAIAKANGTTVEAILAANPAVLDPNSISVGQVLNIPKP